MLNYMQIFRGVAALLVVLHHSAGISEKYFKNSSIEHFFLFGRAGVDFFFVLSGFIIFYAHKNWIGKPGKLGDYLWRRFTRVYPTYWIVFAVTLPLYYLLYNRIPEMTNVIMSLLLIKHETIVYVAWTLVHELTFYLVFATLIINRNLGVVIFFGWFVAILINSPTDIFLDKWFDAGANHIISNYNILFFLGMITAFITSKAKTALPSLFVGILGLVAFLALGIIEEVTNLDEKLNMFYAISSVLIIYGFATWEKTNPSRPSRYWTLLGAASYSIYLVHSQVISGITKLFVSLGLTNTLHVTAAFAISAIMATACGIAFHIIVEKPIVEKFKRIKNKSSVHINPVERTS